MGAAIIKLAFIGAKVGKIFHIYAVITKKFCTFAPDLAIRRLNVASM
jgi:hypothetical protein